MSNYNKIQFVGFEIDTTPKNDHYVGIANIDQDIEARCNLMYDAILEASQNPAISADPGTLKLFMAPEFYFRGPNGAYDLDDVGKITSNLQQKVSGAEWSDWMFVFGTIVAYSIPDDHPKDPDPFYVLVSNTYGIPLGEVRITYNYAFVQAGGYGNDKTLMESLSTIVLKEALSGIDFVPLDMNGMDMSHVTYMDPVTPPGVGKEEQVTNYDGLSVFNMAGMTIGTEICLDHLQQRLKKSAQAPGAPMLQLQLIPSCGMSIKPASIAVEPGGLLFNVDGTGGGRSEARVNGSVLPIGKVSENVNPALFSPVVPVNQIFGYGPGRVAIYNAVNIPAQTYMPGYRIRKRYKEDPFNLWIDVDYDASGDLSNVSLSGTLKNYKLRLDTEALPVNGTCGSEIELAAAVQSGTFTELGKTYDRAVNIDFRAGADHLTGPVMPFNVKYVPPSPPTGPGY